MKRFTGILLIALFILGTSFTTSEEWGQTGHRATGKIAENHLSKRAKRAIENLLDGQSLAFVSTYADDIKSDNAFRKYYTWHFINFPLDSNYKDSKKNPAGDLYTGIQTCIRKLQDKDVSKKDKAFYLKMLVHLVGDLHQPMHIGQEEDRGGNRIQVQWFNQKTNLHSVWDTKMIEGFNMSYLELAANATKLSKRQEAAIAQGTVLDWIEETHVLTKKIYASVEKNDKLSYRYSYDYLETARTQIQKGGIRLAALLNQIFS